jgi:hypothetical protein
MISDNYNAEISGSNPARGMTDVYSYPCNRMLAMCRYPIHKIEPNVSAGEKIQNYPHQQLQQDVRYYNFKKAEVLSENILCVKYLHPIHSYKGNWAPIFQNVSLKAGKLFCVLVQKQESSKNSYVNTAKISFNY